MTITEFLTLHPNVRRDVKKLPDVDFQKLHKKILDSNFLQTRRSLSWLCKNIDKIASGFYDNYEKHDNEFRAPLFGYERPWNELSEKAFFTPIEDIDI